MGEPHTLGTLKYGAPFVTSILLLTEANFVQQKSLLSDKSNFVLTKIASVNKSNFVIDKITFVETKLLLFYTWRVVSPSVTFRILS